MNSNSTVSNSSYIQFILTDYKYIVKTQPIQRTWILYFDTELNPVKMLNTDNIFNSKILCIQIYYGSSINRLLNARECLLVATTEKGFWYVIP